MYREKHYLCFAVFTVEAGIVKSLTFVLQTLQWKQVSCHCRHLYSTFFVPHTNGFSEERTEIISEYDDMCIFCICLLYTILLIEIISLTTPFTLGCEVSVEARAAENALKIFPRVKMIFSSSQDDVQLHINDTNLNQSVNLIKIPNKSQFHSIKSVCKVFCSNAFLLIFQKAFFKVFLKIYITILSSQN